MRVVFASIVCWLCLRIRGQQSGQLTAGDVDDNLNFDYYLKYMARTKDGGTNATQPENGSAGSKPNTNIENEKETLPAPELSDRVVVAVSDSTGTAFSCAVVEIVGTGVKLHTGTNGLMSLFPQLDAPTTSNLILRARSAIGSCPGQECSAEVNASGVANVSLIVPTTSALPTELDVAFVLDTTGSMCDEMMYLKTETLAIFNNVRARHPSVDARMGLVVYKDEGDVYVTKTTQFGKVASDSPPILDLKAASCDGGGDFPEAMDKAMGELIQFQWRVGNVARVAFVVADAPPHDGTYQQTVDVALNLRKQGVKVYGLAASGVENTAEYLMRMLAVVTGGRYLWLTDDSGIGNSHQEPKVLCYQVTRLDQLLLRILESELTGARVEASPSQIMREVGKQKSGVCVIDFQPTSATTTTEPTRDGSDESASDVFSAKTLAGTDADFVEARDSSAKASAVMSSASIMPCLGVATVLITLSHLTGMT
eukprot:TRINITY_DN73852_c0_g1_i1.p1 TRINITY_DN73852_c0_g1~~TRINITY_DN73852_c0_g1_i1.p1  ORF type:complete len:503 (-),score=71.82 TRINITY_DN73852_c0_g1_i1:90-1535(-)